MAGTYRWKPAAGIRVDADVAGAVMERLRVTNNERLTSDMLVAEAQPKASPLHDAFEWNDTRAAKKYRLDQAGHLIRSIEVVEVVQGQSRPIRAFVSVLRDEDRSYTSTAHALSDSDLRQQVVDAAWHELEAWRQRHAELIEFARVFAAIDDQARGAE